MKQYILVIGISLLGCGSLGYLYFRSQSEFNINIRQNLEQFASIEQSDTLLNKEILSLQYFLSQSDSNLDAPIKDIHDFCELNVMQYFFNSRSLSYDQAFENFCKEELKKITYVNAFKEKASAYRKAILFFQDQPFSKLVTRSNTRSNTKLDQQFQVLSQMALIYAMTPKNEVREQFSQVITTILKSKNKPNDQQEFILSNAREILAVRSDLDQLTNNIINSNTNELVSSLRHLYFEDYEKDQSMVSRFRSLLFIASLLLFIFVLYKSILLLQATKDLQNANDNLERRVEERTKELTDSKNQIIEQQQVLVYSSKMSALGQMAAGVAHEINTPLAIIQMRTNQLLDALDTEETVDKENFQLLLSKIDHTTARIAKIIKGLVSFARDGKRDAKEVASLKKIIHETFDLCSERFKNNEIKLELKAEEDVQFLCHPTEISQVILNFLNNSFDAIQKLNEKWILVEIKLNKEDFILSITDSGAGIPADIQDKIMQPFFTTKDVGKGTGLGLSISKGIIKNHSGTIEIDNSSPNTKFSMSFPIFPSS